MNNNNNNNKFFIEIPPNISKYGVISGQAFLVGAFIAFYCKHYYLSFLSVILYVTTMLYWRRVYQVSYIKFADMFIAHSMILLVTIYYAIFYFKPKYRNIWYYFILILATVYSINEYIYYCRTAKKYNETEFNVVPLDYTNKDSEEREEEYYRVVLTHCLFLHIAPVSIYSYCALGSL
jgi:hypothetical protein